MRFLFSAGAAIVLAVSAGVWFERDPDTSAGPVVKLMDKTGHGSGVHIGDGYVLTAAHVTAGKETMAYLRDDGLKGSATVLWENKARDISLVRIDTDSGISAANLECREPDPGETVLLKGNPLNLEHITTYGRVAGSAVPIAHWESVVPVDASIAGGMSGGGMFDTDGDLIGINVGMALQPLGMAATAVGLSLIVPGSAICGLLAR